MLFRSLLLVMVVGVCICWRYPLVLAFDGPSWTTFLPNQLELLVYWDRLTGKYDLCQILFGRPCRVERGADLPHCFTECRNRKSVARGSGTIRLCNWYVVRADFPQGHWRGENVSMVCCFILHDGITIYPSVRKELA